MRIAIPVSSGKLDSHFGHCQSFALIDVDRATAKIEAEKLIDAPPHEPGLLPGWLAAQGANLVLAGGMGARAIQLLKDQGVEVIVGVPQLDPESLVRGYLAGEIGEGANVCDH